MKKVLYVIALALSFAACDDDNNGVINNSNKIISLGADTLSASFELNKAQYQVVLLNTDGLKTGSNTVYAYLATEKNGNLVEIDNPAEYTISVYPEMDMGTMKHSSPNNEDFVWNADVNAYKGTLNFTMSGKWVIYLLVKKGETEIANQIFWTLQL